MTVLRGSQIIDYVRRISSLETDATDAQLLDRFVAVRDEAAFRELLRRHGPMVLGVCGRLLANGHDAEDAFQATFFVLARRAELVRPRDRVGNWLYGVAYRIALKARAAALRRRGKEQEAVFRMNDVPPGESSNELRSLLDRELSRLPEKYRSAVVMCELGGTSRKEAARRLGLAEGTLSSRLAAARVRLARRLSRYGALVSAGALAVLLEQEASAHVPASLLRETSALAGRAIAPGVISSNVSALAEGVISNMWLNNGKWAVSAAIVTIGLGAGLLSLPALSSRPSSGLSAAEPAQKDKKEQGPAVHGVMTAIDAGKSSMTVKVQVAAGKKETEEKTLTLAKDVNVLLNNHPTKKQQLPAGKLADLTPGTIVDARLSPDSKVIEIIATGPNIHAGFKSFDAAQNTITVYVKGQGGKEDKTLQVAKDAKVLLNDGLSKGTPDQEGKLSDLTEGASVGLQLSVDQKTALTIRAMGGNLQGTLKALDTGNSTVTVSVKEDGGLVDKELKLAKGAKIEGNPTVGAGVSVTLSVFDKGVATFVRARD
jgi:RNA polymerase sigma factor (sigma-70 family)